MDKLKGEDRKKNLAVYKTPYKKKYIKDILQLPDIGTERANIKLQIIEQIKSEGFFPFNDDEEKKDKNNEEKKEEKEEKKIDNYDPHSALFDEGELKQYDVGLEEAKEKNRQAHLGKPNARKGKKHKPESIAKMREKALARAAAKRAAKAVAEENLAAANSTPTSLSTLNDAVILQKGLRSKIAVA